jgi:RNA polymerase primary sigma factor
MDKKSSYLEVFNILYNNYLNYGYITEIETLNLMTANNLSLIENSRLTTYLINKGVIFSDNSIEENYLDRSQVDYETVYREIVNISPNQKQFIDFIREIKPPEFLEWKKLIPQVKNGNRFAFNRLFEMYLRVAVRMALNFHKSSNLELDDCIQESAMALTRAIYKFDIYENENLIGNILFRIRNSLERARDNKSRLIRFPVYFFEKVKTVENAISELYQKLERIPTFEEIAEYAYCSIETVEIVVNLTEQDYIEDFLIIGNDGFAEYQIEDKELTPTDIVYSQNEIKDVINKILSTLTKRERKVIQLRFGLIDNKEHTLEEISDKLNVTRERIRQIEAKALRKLRHPTRADKVRIFLE